MTNDEVSEPDSSLGCSAATAPNSPKNEPCWRGGGLGSPRRPSPWLWVVFCRGWATSLEHASWPCCRLRGLMPVLCDRWDHPGAPVSASVGSPRIFSSVGVGDPWRHRVHLGTCGADRDRPLVAGGTDVSVAGGTGGGNLQTSVVGECRSSVWMRSRRCPFTAHPRRWPAARARRDRGAVGGRQCPARHRPLPVRRPARRWPSRPR